MTLALSMQALWRGFLYATVMGLSLGLFYDAIRLVRMLLGVSYRGKFAHGPFDRLASGVRTKASAYRLRYRALRIASRVIDFFLDVFFFVLAGIAFSLFLYVVSDGVFRLLFLIGTVIGFYLYRKTVGRIVFFFLRELASVCYLLLYLAYKTVSVPIRFVVTKIFLRLFRKIYLIIQKKYAIIKIRNEKRPKKRRKTRRGSKKKEEKQIA